MIAKQVRVLLLFAPLIFSISALAFQIQESYETQNIKNNMETNAMTKDEKTEKNLNSKTNDSDGKIPIISNHYSALPSLYALDTVPEEKLSDKITRQYVMGPSSMIVKWTFKKGAVVPLHFHPSEQITWIISGLAQVKSQGKTFLLKEGSIIIFPAYVPHEFTILEDTIDIDYFTPIRNDWITQTDSYLKPANKQDKK